MEEVQSHPFPNVFLLFVAHAGTCFQVVSKRLLPPEQQDMVLGMADHMLALLKIVTR